MKSKKYINWFMAAIVMVVAGLNFTSCEDEPDKFELTSRGPSIRYVRMSTAENADSLVTGAYMDNTICLVGENLTSIKRCISMTRKLS